MQGSGDELDERTRARRERERETSRRNRQKAKEERAALIDQIERLKKENAELRRSADASSAASIGADIDAPLLSSFSSSTPSLSTPDTVASSPALASASAAVATPTAREVDSAATTGVHQSMAETTRALHAARDLFAAGAGSDELGAALAVTSRGGEEVQAEMLRWIDTGSEFVSRAARDQIGHVQAILNIVRHIRQASGGAHAAVVPLSAEAHQIAAEALAALGLGPQQTIAVLEVVEANQSMLAADIDLHARLLDAIRDLSRLGASLKRMRPPMKDFFQRLLGGLAPEQLSRYLLWHHTGRGALAASLALAERGEGAAGPELAAAIHAGPACSANPGFYVHTAGGGLGPAPPCSCPLCPKSGAHGPLPASLSAPPDEGDPYPEGPRRVRQRTADPDPPADAISAEAIGAALGDILQ